MSALVFHFRGLVKRVTVVAFLAMSASAGRSFAATASAWGGDVPRASYVEQARTAAARSLADVEDVVCQEHVERYRSSYAGAFNLVDTIDAQVAVENGIEQYSAIRQNGVDRASLDDIGAVWSDGEYATFIRDARQALNRASLAAGAATTLNGTAAILISFETAQSVSDWDFIAHGRHFQLGFRGEIWVSQATGELLRCRRVADRIDRASGVKSIHWTVDFSVIQVAGKMVSVPVSATYDVQCMHSDATHNAIAFTNYHRFAAETSIRFE